MKLERGRFFVLGVCLLFLVVGLINPTGSPQAGASTAKLVNPADAGGSGQAGGGGENSEDIQPVLLSVPKPYGPVLESIQLSGGTVTQQYKHFDAIAARMPRGAIENHRLLAGPASV